MKKILVIALLCLTGCVPAQQTYLYKSGTTVSQKDADMFECEVAATRAIPQNTQVRSNPGYVTPITTNCYGNSCYTTGGQVVGGGTYSFDANAGLRKEYYARCLAAKGYSATLLPTCNPKSEIREDVLRALGGRVREPQEGACVRPISGRSGNLVYANEILE